MTGFEFLPAIYLMGQIKAEKDRKMRQGLTVGEYIKWRREEDAREQEQRAAAEVERRHRELVDALAMLAIANSKLTRIADCGDVWTIPR